MAARTVKIRHDEETRAYVYKIERDGQVIYIGKGTGRRFHNQKRRFGGDDGSAIIERCKSETHAFKRERELIAEMGPQLNKCAGGNGGRKKRVYYRRSKDEMLMAKIGTRAFAARVLLAVRRTRPELVSIPAAKLYEISQYGSE